MMRRYAVLLSLAISLGAIFALVPRLTISSSPSTAAISSRKTPATGHGHGRRTPPRPPSSHRLTATNTVLAYAAPPIQAKAAYLVDMRTGAVLYEKNADQRLPMASTTKITTAALVLESAGLGDMVTTSNRAATVGESTMSLVKGERLTVRQLLYGLLLNSGNDAAIALAEHVGGTVERFVRMMNLLASTLGMSNTHYANPHGLDAPHHYTSARDLTTIALYAMRNPVFRRIVASTDYHIPATKHNHEHWLGNINRVMFWFPGVDGVKPGGTDAAGLCQVVSDWRNGRHLLAVLLNTPTLVFDIRNLLNFGSRDFQWAQAPAYWDTPSNLVAGGMGSHKWVYYFGAGHYIGGPFLHYFQTHGGLRTLGYPRTEVVDDRGVSVQYFQGGELALDPRSNTAHPLALGRAVGAAFVPRAFAANLSPQVTHGFAGTYQSLGGGGVLGAPVTGTLVMAGHTVQFFQYGALAEVNGAPYLVPLGDAALRLRGWLPARGAADAYPSTLSAASLPAVIRPTWR